MQIRVESHAHHGRASFGRICISRLQVEIPILQLTEQRRMRISCGAALIFTEFHGKMRRTDLSIARQEIALDNARRTNLNGSIRTRATGKPRLEGRVGAPIERGNKFSFVPARCYVALSLSSSPFSLVPFLSSLHFCPSSLCVFSRASFQPRARIEQTRRIQTDTRTGPRLSISLYLTRRGIGRGLRSAGPIKPPTANNILAR